VRVYDSGRSDDGRAYMVMERVRGPTLTERLRRAPRPRPEEALRIGRDVARALAAAHAVGVVHRDLKPDNILLDRDGTTKVLDFGIAKAFSEERRAHVAEPSLTEAHRVVGTPAYMSPEVIAKEPLSPASDNYALGVILYELLLGEPPFREKDAISTMYRHLHEEPRRLRDVDPALPIPGALETLVRDLLQKHAEDRPKDAGDIARRLDALLQLVREEGRRGAPLPTATPADVTAVYDARAVRPEAADGGPPWALLVLAAAVALVLGFALTAAALWALRPAPRTLPADAPVPAARGGAEPRAAER
jgi:serine/threonine-protein kinase